MPTRPKAFSSRRPLPPAARARQYDQERGSARARGYTPEWDRASAEHRFNHPLCVYCERGAFGQPRRVEPATCTDHLYPHRRHAGVFWVEAWWISSCDDCHAGPKQALERQGRAALDALARILGLPVLGT